MGAWVSYGLGSENQNLPAFVVHDLAGQRQPTDQPLFSRLWGSGFLPSEHQGVQFPLGSGDPVLYLSNPPGIDARHAPAHARRPRRAESQMAGRTFGDPEIDTRIAQYEMAYRMQTSVPELTDLSERAAAHPRAVRPGRAQADGSLRRQLPAGPPAGRARRALRPALSTAAGTSTATCRAQIRGQCQDVDQPSAALVTRPEAARPARRHAGDLGRRVRPHRLLPGHS